MLAFDALVACMFPPADSKTGSIPELAPPLHPRDEVLPVLGADPPGVVVRGAPPLAEVDGPPLAEVEEPPLTVAEEPPLAVVVL